MTDLILDTSKYCTQNAIKRVEKFIQMNKGMNIYIDISKYNFLEATKICILSSTMGFINNPDNNITWIVNSIDTQKIINKLKLKNMNLEVKSQNISLTSSAI